MAKAANTAMNAAINAIPFSLSRKVVRGSQRGSEGGCVLLVRILLVRMLVGSGLFESISAPA
jgi:hypothetical protein